MSSTENERPTMKDLNRYVTCKYAADWLDVGIELGLELNSLHTIEKNYRYCETCLQYTLAKWLDLNGNDASWRTLEIALTNVNKAKVGLDPVAIPVLQFTSFTSCLNGLANLLSAISCYKFQVLKD